MRTPLAALIAAVAASVTIGAGAAALAPAAGAAAPSATKDAAGAYVPVTPTRIVSGQFFSAGQTLPSGSLDSFLPAGSTAVLTLYVLNPTGNGAVVAYGGTGTAPGVASVHVSAHMKTANTAFVTTSSSNRMTFYNNSTGSLSLYVDLSGYYTGGTAAAVKAYHPVGPTRVVNTTTGAGHNHKGPIGAHGSINPIINHGNSGVPSQGLAGAVAVTITAYSTNATGYLNAGAYNLPIAPEAAVHWAAGQSVSSFAIVPVDADGQLTITNESGANIDVNIDVVGWYGAGSPQLAGMLNNVPAARVYDTRSGGLVQPHSSRTIALAGKGGVPLSGVRAAVLTIAALAPTTTGGLVAYSGATKPGTTNLQFYAGHTTSNVAFVKLASNEQVTVYNNSAASLNLVVDVTAWVTDEDVNVPPTQAGRYVENLSPSNTSANANTMAAEGAADAASNFVLLDIGAQLNNKTGVQLAQTSTNLTYATLVDALQAYVTAYAAAGGDGKIAIGTNNDGQDWTNYSASRRGADWANKVIDKIDAPSGVTIAGADDIEAGFGTHKLSDAQAWKAAYRAATSAEFIFNGSADGCAVDFGKVNTTCSDGWTELDYYNLAAGSGVRALPQIYNSRLAIQWADISATGHAYGKSGLTYVGALTEHPFDGSYTPANGYSALWHALSTVISPAALSLPRVVELHADRP